MISHRRDDLQPVATNANRMKTLRVRSREACVLLLMTSCSIFLVVGYVLSRGMNIADGTLVDENCTPRDLSSASTDDGKLYVTISGRGRFANWMYAYASLIGIAIKNNRIPYILQDHPLTSYFELRHTRSDHAQCRRSFVDNMPCTFNTKFEHLPDSNVTIDGYIQSWKYFSGLENIIRKEFVFKKEIRLQATELYAKYSPPKTTSVCVHVRRTDMMIPSSTKIGFREAPKAYIKNAINYMRHKFENVTFLVVSDDVTWCKTNLKAPDVVVSSENTRGVHMALCSLCRHSIITTGTFGWWGAWLGGGHTVYYKNFPTPGTKVASEFTAADFYPRDWVAISHASDGGVSLTALVLCFYVTFCVT